MRNNRKNMKIGGGILFGLITGFTIWAGFDETYGVITDCKVEANSYVEANYSELNTYSCTDSNGNASTCSEWDYWERPASDVFTVTTQNGNISYSNVKELTFKTSYGFYNVPMPQHDVRMSSHYDFDDFSFYNKFKHTVSVLKTVLDENGNETKVYDYTTKNESFYPTCEKARKQGNSMSIKTFYGNSYNVELQTD